MSIPESDARSEGVPDDAGFMWRLVHLEPVMLKGVLTTLMLLLGSFGLVIGDEKQAAVVGFALAAVSMLQAVWTRRSVTPNAKVVVFKPDPLAEPEAVAPGSAVSSNVIAVANAAADTPDSTIPIAELPFPEGM